MNAADVVNQIETALNVSGVTQKWVDLQARVTRMDPDEVTVVLREIGKEAAAVVAPLARAFMQDLSKRLGATLLAMPPANASYKEAVLQTDRQWRDFHGALPALAKLLVDVDGFEEGLRQQQPRIHALAWT